MNIFNQNGNGERKKLKGCPWGLPKFARRQKKPMSHVNVLFNTILYKLKQTQFSFCTFFFLMFLCYLKSLRTSSWIEGWLSRMINCGGEKS